MPKISSKRREVGNDRFWHYNWVRQREIGYRFPLGFSNQFHQNLYSSIHPCDSWDYTVSAGGAHHGGVFNLEFSPDGSLLVAACERRSFLIFDSLSRKQIHAVDNAHVDCVNCVRFLDSRIFVTCSDDKTVALWDTRNLKSRIRTLYGHSNWVKNVEYSAADGLLVTSGFDGSIYSWDINSYAENGFTLKRLFHTNGLMRTRLTPDASKMVICTTSGYLMIIHDLDLHKLSQDLHGFKPNLYRCMQQSRTTVPSATMYTHLFSRKRKRNRIEFISDFPVHDDAEVVSSLQIHPQGWCALSRNISHEDVSEWTCVHDIQDCVEPEEDADTNYDTEDDSTIDDTTARPPAEVVDTSLNNSNSEDNDVAGAARVGGSRTLLHRRERGFRGFVPELSTLQSGPTEDRDAFDFREGLGLSSSRRSPVPAWHPVRRLDRVFMRTRPTGRSDVIRRMRTYRSTRSNDVDLPPEDAGNPASGSDASISQPATRSVAEADSFNAPPSSRSATRSNGNNQISNSDSPRNRWVNFGIVVASTSNEAGPSSNSTRASPTSPGVSASPQPEAPGPASGPASSPASGPASGQGPRAPGDNHLETQAARLLDNNFRTEAARLVDNHFQNMELQAASSGVWEALVAIRAARAGREARNARMSEYVRRYRSGDPRWVSHPASRSRDNDSDNTVQRQDRISRESGDNDATEEESPGRSVLVLESRSNDFNRRRRLYSQSDPILRFGNTRNDKIHQNIPRLTHYIEEPNVGKGFIKELCFSSEGRIMCSPFGYGVRLLAFSPNCAELSSCLPQEPPVKLFELSTHICHTDYVVSSKFSPRHCQLVSGCLKGKIVWHLPVL